MINLKNKLFFITGATGHLGSSICEGLAKNSANLVICSTSKLKAKELSDYLNRSYKIKSMPYELDISSVIDVKKTIKEVLNDFGKVDCLVNNAFYTGECDFNNFSASNFNKGMEGTINQVISTTNLLIPELEKTEGCVINIASMYGMVSPDPGIYKNRKISYLDYGIGKSAIIHYTKYAAVQLAKNNIRVNCISPGPFPNDVTKKDTNFISELEKKVPLGRVGEANEIVGSVLFLSSNYASYITGHNLVVDGGWTIW